MKHIKAKSVKEGVDCADFADRRLIYLLKNRPPVIDPVSGHKKGRKVQMVKLKLLENIQTASRKQPTLVGTSFYFIRMYV